MIGSIWTRQCVRETKLKYFGSACRSCSKTCCWCDRPISMELPRISGIAFKSTGTVAKSAPAVLTHSRTATTDFGALCMSPSMVTGKVSPTAFPSTVAAMAGCSPKALTTAWHRSLTWSTKKHVSLSPPTKLKHAPSGTGVGRSVHVTIRPSTSNLFLESCLILGQLSGDSDSQFNSKCVREMLVRFSFTGTMRSKNSGWCCRPILAVRKEGYIPSAWNAIAFCSGGNLDGSMPSDSTHSKTTSANCCA
mmetsp:Transcript_105004/g.185992  ORF Transcript_105004/g.185992 Transcript_105004/m.185992 type:complete len:249 (+) Transcript_105004:555-1301(+)